MNVRSVFEYALAREREGLRFFGDRAESASHASVREVFQHLVREEQGHVAFIEARIARLEGGMAAEPPSSEEGFFAARAASEMIEQTTAEAMVPDLPVLRMAWLIERDLAEWYRQAAAKADGEAREALERLAAWEEEHERFFRSIHDRVLAQYEAMPWGG